MPDSRLFDSSSLIMPPEPRVDVYTLTNATDEGFMPPKASYPELLGAIEALEYIIAQTAGKLEDE
jgi:hypothetical protein